MPWTTVDLHDLHTGSGLKLKLEQETPSRTEAYMIHIAGYRLVVNSDSASNRHKQQI